MTILKKKYKNLFSFLLFCIILYIFPHKYLRDLDSSMKFIQSDIQSELNQCQKEWIQLNDDIFFRNSLSYYFLDTNEIRLFLERNNNKKYYDFKFYVKIILNNRNTNVYQVTKVNSIHMDTVWSYTTEMKTFKFNLTSLIDNTEKNYRLQVLVSINNTLMYKNPIDLIIKNFNAKDHTKKHSMICAKSFYFPNSYLNHFEFWIQMNRINGYDKISLFNNSFDTKFNDLFIKYKDFIDVHQFQCVPNFYKPNKNNITFVTFERIKNVFNSDPTSIHVHFEYINFNECYLKYKDKYKYITVIDDDESIIPRLAYKHELDEFVYQKIDSYPQKKDKITKKSSKIAKYIENLTETLNNGNKTNLAFKMGFYLKHNTMKIIFNKIGEFLNSFNNSNSVTSFDFTIHIDIEKKCLLDKNLYLNLTIKNKDDFKYIKYLYEMHMKYIEPFLTRNKNILDKFNDTFNRFYYFTGKTSVSSIWLVKSIHNTLQTTELSTHYAKNRVDNKYVPEEYGHSCHFKTKYCAYFSMASLFVNRILPVKELYFDYNYFHFYFKPILNNMFETEMS